MAIHRFLQDFSISPASAERLADAFEQTRHALKLDDSRGPIAELVARKIIEVHISGVDDPGALTAAVLGHLQREAPQKQHGLLEGCSVLVVEDEYFLADDLHNAFKSLGAEVVGPVGDLREALARAEDGGFDFAVLNVRLQGGDCFELADRLMARKIPFAFATGMANSSLPPRFSAVRCWTKPYDPLVLAHDVMKLWPG